MANAEWQAFLDTQGARVVDGITQDFGEPAKEIVAVTTSDIMCDLSHLGVLEISGADAGTFLQGQVTNDIKLLSHNNAHYTGYCSPKGRLLALFFAYGHNENLYLQFNRTLIEPITKRLKMYVLRSKVVIQDASDASVRIGLSGENIASLLAPFFTKIPISPLERTNTEQAILIRLPGETARFELITDTTLAQEIWSALKPACTPVGINAWEWLEIQAGIPDITLDTQEEFVPQMVNLDTLNGISLKKGCYTGQEIVARTHYLGKIKRRTYLGHLNATSPTQIGADICNQNNEPVGKVVRIAASPTSGWDVLSEIRTEYADEKLPLFTNGEPLQLTTRA